MVLHAMEVCSNGQKDRAVLDSRSLTPLVVQENVPGVEFGALKQAWGGRVTFFVHLPFAATSLCNLGKILSASVSPSIKWE